MSELIFNVYYVYMAAVTCFPFQAEKMRSQLASLPPLYVPKLPSRGGGRPGVLSGALYRKTDQLLETLLQMSANVKVVDITGKSPGKIWKGQRAADTILDPRFYWITSLY